jgi:hypothetical protein
MRGSLVFGGLILVACSSNPAPVTDLPDAQGVDGSSSPDASDASSNADTNDAAIPIKATPYACPKNAPEAVYVSEVAPPATMAPWATAIASVTYANCGTTTWSATMAPPAGIKLGPAAPHDLGTWTPNRISLPADVPPQFQIAIPITIHAPPLTGPHPYAFELVRDGVAWLGQPTPPHTIDVQPGPPTMVALCNGVMADASGITDAHTALQTCIDATPNAGTLALPPGIFRISGVVSITHTMTLTTANTSNLPNCLDYAAPKCAVLRADDVVSPSAASTRGFFRLGSLGTQVSNVTLDHIVLDGNRATRLQSNDAKQCAMGNNGDGINGGANCASCTLAHIVSARALCGTGMEWDGDGVTVKDSVFFGNGDHATNNMWSDGLTIHKSDNALVDGSQFIDNSDVGFISGGGVNAKYTNNIAYQLSQVAFAAVMLDNFNNGALGDHTGAVMSGNSVSCPAGCHFGIELGPHPWYQSPNIKGGTITNNTVAGANIEINAQGTGTNSAPTIITNNTLAPVPAKGLFQCGNVNGTSALNVSKESVVDLKGGSATGTISVPCP